MIYEKGMIVANYENPTLGQGEIIKVEDGVVYVHFREHSPNRVLTFSTESTCLDVLGHNNLATEFESKVDNTNDVNIELESKVDYTNNLITELESKVDYFISPKSLFSLDDLSKSPPPCEPGVYGWYFDEIPNGVPTSNCITLSWWLWKKTFLYAGKANDLQRRILEFHFRGDADVSSLRLSLGCLLGKNLGICLLKRPRRKENKYAYTFGDEGETKLTRWMKKHAKVAWVCEKNYKELEIQVIKKYNLPLNTELNDRLFTPLSDLKINLRLCAVTRDSKPSWAEIKSFYKKYELDCKVWNAE